MLEPYNLWYLRTVTFIMVIAAAVQFTELTVKKVSPQLFQMLGIYLPLITTNCAVLGIAILLVEHRMNFISATLFGFASSVGYSLVMVIFAGLRERMALADIPPPVRRPADRIYRRQPAGAGVHGVFRNDHDGVRCEE